MRKKAIVIGSINLDITANLDHHPKVGETVLAMGASFSPGGKGANQALALQKMDIDVTMVGKTGKDIFAELALSELRKHCVNLSEVKQCDEKTTGLAMLWVDKTGNNSIVVIPGANAELLLEDMQELDGIFSSSAALIMQLEIPTTTVFKAALAAKRHRVPVILNVAPAAKLSDEMFSAINVLICNQTEASLLLGKDILTIDEAKVAARSLLEKIGEGKVIITLGNMGAIYTENRELVNYQPAFKVNPIDSVGAGDAFVGGLAACLIQGKPLKEAVIWGNACGALATTCRGAQLSLPEKKDVESFIRSHQLEAISGNSK